MKTRLEEKHYECFDGCCYETWYDLYLDEKLVDLEYRFSEAEQCYKYVLETHFNCEIDDGY